MVKTKLDNLNIIELALKYLGLSYVPNGFIRMWNSSIPNVPLVIQQTRYDIGIVLGEDGNYTLKADSYAWKHIYANPALKNYKLKNDQGEQFAGILQQACNIIKSQIMAEKLGHQIEFSEPDDNNVIHAKVLARE